MHTTDWIDVGAEFLPRSVKRAELTEDLTPVLTRVIDSSTPDIQP